MTRYSADVSHVSYECIVSFGCVCWGENIPKRDRDISDMIFKKAVWVVGKEQELLSSVYTRRLIDKLQMILNY